MAREAIDVRQQKIMRRLIPEKNLKSIDEMCTM